MTEEFLAYHEARARGGVGLIVLEAVPVHESAGASPLLLSAYADSVVEQYKRIADAIHPHGARVFVQLFHGGRERTGAPPRPVALAPSAVPSPRFKVEPKALRAHEIDEIIAGYARATELALLGGIDGVEISAAHNYLPEQFFAAEANRRDDEWARPYSFLQAAVNAARTAAGDAVVGVRLSADASRSPWAAESVANVVDYVSITLGDSSSYFGAARTISPPPIPDNVIGVYAEPFAIGRPLIATSRITDPADADRLIADGKADAVGMTRALIADPEMPDKARRRRTVSILRCIGCNVCHAHYQAGVAIACAINPRSGRESSLPRAVPASQPQRIVIVGAGPAGLAAAVEAASAGHEVTVFERGPSFGGQLAIAARVPGQETLAQTFIDNYQRALGQLDIDLRLNTDAGLDTILACTPDAAIIATGAQPYAPQEWVGLGPVQQAWDALLSADRPTGERIVVADWGGDWAALGCAEMLQAAGNEVTLGIGAFSPGENFHPYNRTVALERLYRGGVHILNHVDLEAMTDDGICFSNIFARDVKTLLRADRLVIALGRVPNDDLEPLLSARGIKVVEVGDCRAPRSLEEATLEGTLAIQQLGLSGER